MPIYLDNAATSFPKPESVYAAIDQANREFAVSAGRGRYQRAEGANRLLNQTRIALANLIGVSDARQISFAFSGTDALSTAIFGLLQPGDHVITSAVDHTSVLRPLWHLQKKTGIELDIVGCSGDGIVDVSSIESAIKPTTKMVCLTHASNVTGAVQDVSAVGELCDNNDVTFLLDAAQTIGHLAIDINKIKCDVLCAPGHKALHGPPGTGFLFVAEHLASQCQPLRFGGTGSGGNELQQPTSAPGKFESGNLNLPGIAGLLAGVNWLSSESGRNRIALQNQLCDRLRRQLGQIESVEIYGSIEMESAAVSFNIDGLDCQTAGMILDTEHQIECRTGMHCAPLIHEQIGSEKHGGTIRFSPGVFTTLEEIDEAVAAVKRIASKVGQT